jgi:hydrophobic/amphiphilic exporter-1 (mainly G- bacteria), HAE1 family
MQIADTSIRRPVFAVMLIGALVTLGWISLGRIGVDLFPKVEFPYVAVTTALPGASPDAIESEISDVIEEYVNRISGIKELRSVSSEGLSQVFIQFELEEEVDIKAQDVRDKVSLAQRDLPQEAEAPIIEKIDPASAPILSVLIGGGLPIRDLTEYAEDIVKQRLQRLVGVGSVSRVGGREREIRIWLNTEALRSYKLTATDVMSAIRAEHVKVPGGQLETKGGIAEFSVNTMGEVQSVEEFGSIVVSYRKGIPTFIRDVARVEDGLEDQRTYAELDGVPGVSLAIRRQSGRNTVAVAHAVQDEVERLRETAPPGIKITLARDTSKFIESSARDVSIDMVVGGILAILVTLAFLRSVRTTLIVSTAIPASIVSTFFLFYVMGFTLNLLTLMALSVSIGLLIDDAIVVLENIHRHIEDGLTPREAASRGTAEVGPAVIAGTLSVLAVFLPIAFMQGLIGRFFFEYGLVISFAVAISLLVALTLTPMLCAYTLRSGHAPGRIFLAMESMYSRLDRAYGALLARVLKHRLIVIGLAAAAVYLGISVAGTIPLEFSSNADRSEFEAVVELPQGAGIETTKVIGRRAATAIGEVEHVESVFMTVGAGDRGEINVASIYGTMTPKQKREAPQAQIISNIREVLQRVAPEAKRVGVNEIPWISGGGFTAYNLEYGLQGDDLAVLESTADQIAAGMRASPLYADTALSFEPGKPEIQVLIDRKRSADLGVPLRPLASTVRALVGGVEVAQYEELGKRFGVRVRLEAGQRDELHEMERIQVRSVTGRLIDLASVGTLKVASASARIDRRDRARSVTIFANTSQGVALGTAADGLDEIVAQVGLPLGYQGKHEGTAKRMKDTAAAVVFAFMLALLALYMILASQFNSFTQPAVIMLSAPLSFVGAFAALAWSGMALSIWAQIGLIALMGLVMKNGILLVDYANQLCEKGIDAHTAMLEAGPVRLRPVLMTAFSTIFGMIPVALANSDAAEFRNPMGVLVIGGLCSSTLLTLLVVPVAYTLLADLRAFAERLINRIRSRDGVEATP